MRKLLIIVTVMAMVLMAGCGGNDKKSEKVSGGKTQITFWHVYSENFGAPVIKEMVEAFNRDEVSVFFISYSVHYLLSTD